MKPIARRITCVVISLVWACEGVRSSALAVEGVTAANASAPADDPGWLNVGDRGIYIGNRWVLTAYHARAGPPFFAGVGSLPASGAQFRLQNPAGSGLSQYTDLLMYQLASDPGLPALTLAGATPPVGAAATLIGDGNAITP